MIFLVFSAVSEDVHKSRILCIHVRETKDANIASFFFPFFKVDLDLGNYERFLDITLTRDNNITTGKIYQVNLNLSFLFERQVC